MKTSPPPRYVGCRALSIVLHLPVIGLLIAFAICGVLDAGATSDSRVWTFEVSVLNDKSLPVVGALVELKVGNRLISAQKTDGSGKAIVRVRAPGIYSLEIQRNGYLPNQTALEVGGKNVTPGIDVVMSTAALSQQSVEVKGEPSSPTTETTNSPAKLSPANAKDTPLRPATLTDALPLVPGIVRAPDGSVRIAGFTEDHSALLVNSVDVTDPATGDFGISVPIDSVQTIDVAEVPYSAEYGRFTAGVVAADTKRGGDKWAYSLNDPFPDFFIRSGHLEGVQDAAPRLNLGGPLFSNRVYFLEGMEYLLNKQEVRTLPFSQSLSTSKAINSFTQVDAIPSSNQTLTGSFHLAPHSVQYAGLDYFNPQPVTPTADFHEMTAALTDRLGLDGGMLQSTVASRIVSSGVAAQGTADMVLSPTRNFGNYFSQESRRANRFEWIEKWTPHTLHFAGDHTLGFGSTLAHSENVGNFSARPVLIEDKNGHVLQRIDFSQPGVFDLTDTDPAAFVEDHWVLNSYFALDAGLRVESQTITHTSRAAPRMGFLWTPDSGTTILRGGIGVFYDAVPLDTYAFSRYPRQTITSYNPLGLPVGPAVQYINLTAELVQSNFPFIDRSTKRGNFAPYSLAWNMAIDRTIGRILLLRVKYLQSHEQDMLTLQPEIIASQNAFVLGTSGWAHVRQADFTARIGALSNRQFFFSYVRQYAQGDINAASSYLGNFPFPVVRENLIASLPSEIPNRFLLWGHYGLRKLMITPHLELRSGFPYQPTNLFQQYVAPVPGPQHRFPNYFSLDMRVSKDIQVGPKHAVRLSGTITNLTNHFNPLDVHANIGDPQYGTFFGNYDRRFVIDFDVLF